MPTLLASFSRTCRFSHRIRDTLNITCEPCSRRSFWHVPKPMSPRQSSNQRRSHFEELGHGKQQKRYRQAFSYQRFQQSQSLLRRWVNGRYFYYQLGGLTFICGTYYSMNLEEVPVTHRSRFRVLSYETEKAQGDAAFKQVLNELGGAILPKDHPHTRTVERVARTLIPHSGLVNDEWMVFVVDSSEANAFVIPGGKIFFFAGMFQFCKTDDEVAAVIGHEIGHNVAHHAAERASVGAVVAGLSYLLWFLTGVDVGLQSQALDLMILKPGSRIHEREADYIGLMMMAEACWDPRAAFNMWAKMEATDKQGMPQWLSTHPSHSNRMEKIREWLPEAEEKSREKGCRLTRQHAQGFRSLNMGIGL